MAAPDIFLSYNRGDMAIARTYAEAFAAEGFDVWWDQTLKSGDAYDEVTEAALRSAKSVVVLWSPRSVVSRWVRSEATIADRNKTLAPVMIELCERPVMFELTQTADLMHWAGESEDPTWRNFLADVGRIVGRDVRLVPKGDKPIVAPKPALPAKPSIAVLPFVNLGGDPEQAYFVDGLMEEITGALTRIRTLFVISSGSTLSLRDQNLGAVEAAKKLDVRYVLEGNVRAASGRIRISVKLIDAAHGTQIWADRFDDTLEDVFALQDRVAISVAGVIEFSVQKAEAVLAAHRPTSDLRGYDLYLRALAPFRTYDRDNLFNVLEMMRQALELDPHFALAHSLAASCHAVILRFGWADDPVYHQQQLIDLVGKSVQHGPDDAQVLSSAALAYWVFGGFDEAKRLAERAAALNPGSSFPLIARGQLAATAGDIEIAEECIEQSMRLDPYSPNRALQLAALCQTRYVQGRFNEAADLAREWAQINKSPLNVAFLAASEARLGHVEAARAALVELRILTDVTFTEIGALVFQDQKQNQAFVDGLKAAADVS